MKHKIVITTPYPTDEEVIRILGMTPAEVAYVDRVMVKIGLPKAVRHNPAPVRSSRTPQQRRTPPF